MKCRQGLVSNSSASSFICTLAKVVDKEKFAAWNKDRGFIPLLGEEILTAPEWELYNDKRLSKFLLPLEDDFDDRWGVQRILRSIAEDPGAEYILAGEEESFEGDEGVFTRDGYYDWDAVDLSFFSELQQDIFLAGPAEGLEVVDSDYYAARNG